MNYYFEFNVGILVVIITYCEARIHEHSSGTEQLTPVLLSLDTSGPHPSWAYKDRPQFIGRRRYERDTPTTKGDGGKLIVNVTELSDHGHNEAIVHWSGNESRVGYRMYIGWSIIKDFVKMRLINLTSAPRNKKVAFIVML